MVEFSSRVDEQFNQQEKKMEASFTKLEGAVRDINKQLAPLLFAYGIIIAVVTAVITVY